MFDDWEKTPKDKEIERLRAEIERWRDSNNRLRAECEHQAREVAELRGAFKCFRCGDSVTPLYCLNCAEELRETNIKVSE